MPDFAIATSTLKIVVTLIILAAALYGFIREKYPPDVTALLALLALLITGVLTPSEAFAGFSHPATVSVAAVLVLAAGIERTGALTFVARRLLQPLGKSELLLTVTVMAMIGALSAFVANTAAVAIFIPVVLEVCRHTGISPGRVLMPMSHAATFGGMCTLIGTSTNLVAHEFARNHGLPGFSMFELGKVGLPMLIAGFLYILLVGRLFLPRTKHVEEVALEHAKDYLSELIVLPGSPWIDREVSRERLRHDFEVEMIELVRQGQSIDLSDGVNTYQVGDSLRVLGSLEHLLQLGAQKGLELHRPDTRPESQPEPEMVSEIHPSSPGDPTGPAEGAAAEPPPINVLTQPEQLPLAEVVVLPGSPLIGRTLKEARFAEHYDAVVLALRRRAVLRDRPSTTPIRAGDLLVVEGESAALQALAETHSFLVVGVRFHPQLRPGKLGITILTLAAVVAVVSFGLASIVTAATAGCAVLMLTGCLRPREAYQAIDLSIIFLLAGALALGAALDKTGVTEAVARGLAGLQGVTGPFVMVLGFFVVALVVSELMSNSGTVALLAPVAVSSAAQMGINPMALLAAVTFGSSAAFSMPIGYQTSLMIYGPGGYRFRDYVRMGIPLDLLLAALALWLIPKFWPLTSP
jgi:di/tricarboxylate transporter